MLWLIAFAAGILFGIIILSKDNDDDNDDFDEGCRAAFIIDSLNRFH
jgi:hypothetical protein